MSNNQQDKGGNGVIKVLIPLLLGIGLIVFLYRSCSNIYISNGPNSAKAPNHLTIDPSVNPTENTADAEAAQTPAKESLKVKLIDGVEIEAYKGGIEDQLVAFLNKGDYKNMSEEDLKKSWFDFDNLNFETGSAKLTADSKKQLDNIVAILTAYSDIKLKIGGYTDKTGNEEVNKKLSGERAEAVKTYLTNAGKGSQVDGAEGYGSEFAKYAADAPEADRAKDRRISVSIRK